MVYEIFLQTVRNTLQERLGDDYHLILRQIPKNNGLILDGLSIEKVSEKIAPTIYLNSFYEESESGVPLERLIQNILRIYHEHSSFPSDDMEQLFHPENLKEKLFYKLVHTDSNCTLLSDIPHISFLDLSIVYYVLLSEDSSGQMTALIHNQHLDSWNIPLNQLHHTAFFNTPLHFPPLIRKISDIILEISNPYVNTNDESIFVEDLQSATSGLPPLYILTNSSGMYGASCILYDGVLKNFASQLETDLIILPSSVHEVLLFPYSDTICFEDLRDMVSSVNQSEVPQEDRLSDQVYIYRRQDDMIYTAPDFSPGAFESAEI